MKTRSLFKAIFVIHITVLLFLFFFYGKVYSQSRIYGVAGNNLVYFDYRSGEYDTVVVPNGYFPYPNVSFGCTIDPFNGKYFYNASPLYETGSLRYVDLNTLETGSTCSFPERDYIEYNCLNNSLVFVDSDGYFYKYAIENDSLTLLSNINSASATIDGNPRTYNPLKNEYLYIRPGGNYFYDVIDGLNGALIHSQQINFYGGSALVTDYQTGYYFGIYHDSVIRIDPYSGSRTSLLALPFEYGHLGSQMSVYDQDSAKYIISAFDGNEGYYIVVDVNTPKIDTMIIQPNIGVYWQQIYCKPRTVLTRIGDSLVCSKGIVHEWYLNGNLIQGANSNILIPNESGLYHVTVEYPTYVSTSKEILFVVTGHQVPKPPSIRIFPNPVSEILNIQFQWEQELHSFPVVNIEICDQTGQLIYSMKDKNLFKQYSIDMKPYPNGLYILKISAENIYFTRKFLHMNY